VRAPLPNIVNSLIQSRCCAFPTIEGTRVGPPGNYGGQGRGIGRSRRRQRSLCLHVAALRTEAERAGADARHRPITVEEFIKGSAPQRIEV
jgi:hypothetical protein